MNRLLGLILIGFVTLSIAKDLNPSAIAKLAYNYENGIGVEKNLAKAKELYKKAAKLGDSDAKLALTLLELEEEVGKGVSVKNSVTLNDREYLFNDLKKEDIEELIEKAKKGDKDAIFSLGVLYENGYGLIKQDKKRAISLYKKAHRLGSKKATEILRLKGVIN